MARYILVATILVGLRATEDDHDVLYIGVAILVVIVSFLLSLVQVVALRRVLATLSGDMLLIRVAILGQMIHQEAVNLAWLIHDLVKPILVASLLLVADVTALALAVLSP